MRATSNETVAVASDADVLLVRQMVRELAKTLGFRAVGQTKVVTVVSELARNMLVHGGGGLATIETVQEDERQGIRLTFSDHGPGIPDIKRALVDGYTTGRGMGLGLSGSKRLSDEFDIRSEVGVGTQVTATSWS